MHAGWLAGWVSVCVLVCFLLGLQTLESLWRDTTASLSLIVAINSARNKKSGGTLHTISDLRNSTSSAPKWNALVPPFFPPRHCRDLCVSLPARADYLVGGGGGGGAEEGELAFTRLFIYNRHFQHWGCSSFLIQKLPATMCIQWKCLTRFNNETFCGE
jgi:hypothetical protein